ncbi:MAG: PAS domain-containing protein [Gallionella sp.]|nr:PAS domain-containing protein [Gallionella sp.]
MKDSSASLNTLAKAVIAVGLIVIVVELLIMMVVENIVPPSLHKALYLVDPVLLIAIVSPFVYFLILKPMRTQHAELAVAHNKIGQAHQEWMDALDMMSDAVFLHDDSFRILRCNKAYQKCAGIPFKQIIGQPYYEVFPKIGVPLPCCMRSMEKAAEEEVTVGEAVYRSRAFFIKDEQGAYLYSVHTLEDITERRQVEAQLAEQLDELRRWNEVTLGRENRVLELKHEVNELLGKAGSPPRYPSAESDDPQEI